MCAIRLFDYLCGMLGLGNSLTTQSIISSASETLVYESDFSVDKDGWASFPGVALSTREASVTDDGSVTKNNVLKLQRNQGTNLEELYTYKDFTSELTIGKNYYAIVDWYAPNSNDAFTGLHRVNFGNASSVIDESIQGSWTESKSPISTLTVLKRVYIYAVGSGPTDTNDSFYISSVKIYEVG